jgi:nucleoside-diphosphate-sugar epimerase
VEQRKTRVLYVGGTGTISAACVRRSVEIGMEVFVLNRGVNAKHRTLPPAVVHLSADFADESAVTAAIDGREFDAVVDFLSYTRQDATRAVRLFRERTKQYVQISSASVYRKPLLQWPIVESTVRRNPYVAYSRDKIAAEDELMRAFDREDFPATIVRPAHTYDAAQPPIPGDWTVIDRVARGAEVVVPGDGTSLWTLTHSDDLAVGLVGLLGHPGAVGEDFHITSDSLYTWDEIYTIVASALDVEPKLVHVPSDLILAAAPDWFWSELIIGDLAHTAIFDNAKIKRYVPEFAPRVTFHAAAREIVQWRAAHPSECRPDKGVDQIMNRLVNGHREAAAIFAKLGADATA